MTKLEGASGRKVGFIRWHVKRKKFSLIEVEKNPLLASFDIPHFLEIENHLDNVDLAIGPTELAPASNVTNKEIVPEADGPFRQSSRLFLNCC